MSDRFTDALKAQLHAAVLAALAAEGIEVDDELKVVAISPVLGQTEIPISNEG